MAPKPPDSLFKGCQNTSATSLVSRHGATAHLLIFRQLTSDYLLQPHFLFRGSFLLYQTPCMEKGVRDSSTLPLNYRILELQCQVF